MAKRGKSLTMEKLRVRNCRIQAGLLSCLILLCAIGAFGQNALDQVRKKGELVIATDATYPPFEYLEGEKIVGFDVDIGNEIGKELGVKVKFESLDWKGVLPSLESGKADLVMSGVTITDERKQNGYVFSRPYFLSGQTIARRKGDTRIQSLEDLKDKIASVQENTTGETALLRAGVPKDHLRRFNKLQEGLEDTRNKNSDATVADLPALKGILRKGFSELELVGEIPVKEYLGIVAWKTKPELRDAVNAALEKIIADGRYADIYKRWLEEPADAAMLAELDRIREAGQTTGPIIKKGLLTILQEALPQLLNGVKLTLFLTFMALLSGIPVGLCIALLRLSHVSPFRALAMVYVEVIRGTPLLIQIFIIYFVLPKFSINLSPILSGVTALSLNAAAYIAEIFRAGIQSIDVGQMEAARALGMDYGGAMRWVILPQTMRRVLPPLTNEGVALLKDSSLVSVVGLAELMRVGGDLVVSFAEPTPIYLTVALTYLLMTLPLTFLVRRLENAWQPVSRKSG